MRALPLSSLVSRKRGTSVSNYSRIGGWRDDRQRSTNINAVSCCRAETLSFSKRRKPLCRADTDDYGKQAASMVEI